MQARTAVVPVAFTMALGLLSPSLAQDDPYPSRPIRLLVSSAPGGNPDILGRLLAERMTQDFGKAVVVENVQGAEPPWSR
jgi:tripartite-type tricarboxylate transporter receptor subunit TctC